jgi:hypothetical protein
MYEYIPTYNFKTWTPTKTEIQKEGVREKEICVNATNGYEINGGKRRGYTIRNYVV